MWAASEAQLEDLIQTAAAAARSDYVVESALKWADGYVFPAGAVKSDMAACLAAANFDFEAMVRDRLESLTADCLNITRIEMLREDNPERALLFGLVVRTKVHLQMSFEPNGHLEPRTPLRDSYLVHRP